MVKFPLRVNVVIENPGMDDQFLTVEEDAQDLAKVGASIRIGIYKLEYVAMLTAQPKISIKGRK